MQPLRDISNHLIGGLLVGVMQAMFAITQSLDGLGALDRVTTDRLLELFSEQLGAVPIR